MSDRTQQPAFRAAELGAILARHYPDARPHLVAEVVTEMQRGARAAVSFATDRCNYDLGDPDDSKSAYARRRARQDRTESRINATLALAKLWRGHAADSAELHPSPAVLTLGGDPRGPCARLVVPGMPGDGWGDGFAVF